MTTADDNLIIVIGRGHSGTSALSHTLLGSRVFLGWTLNSHGDTLPPKRMYDAGRILAKYVHWRGGLQWDFTELQRTPVEPDFETAVRDYLKIILASNRPHRGWKLPETTFAFPWIARMFPSARFVHIVRDPRDGLLRGHITDDLTNCNVQYPETDDCQRRLKTGPLLPVEKWTTPGVKKRTA